MNLFIIPSWYPVPNNPISGSFFREQAEAVSEFMPDTQVIVSLWGQGMPPLSPRCFLRSVNTLIWYMTSSQGILHKKARFCEIQRPALAWSTRIMRGGVQGWINANRKNLLDAIKNYGSINLIHAHVCYPGGYIARILSDEFKIPYVLTEHMSPFPFPAYIRNGHPIPEIDEAFRKAAITIAVSPALADRIHAFGYPRPFVIPNMVNEVCFHSGVPTEEKFTFFTMGGLVEQKGIDVLLKAIASLHLSFEKVQFWIAGDGPEKDNLHDMANNLNISKLIRWLGPVQRTNAPELFRRCHVFVLPSRHESFGVVYAEAIASGKPIIATRCGGPEFIVNQENGILVDVGDVSSLATAIEYMTSNWEHYSPESIRKDFETRFSRQAVIGQLHILYEKIIQDNIKK